MARRTLTTRLTRISRQREPAPRFRAFARAAIVYRGEEPRPDAVERLARWYAGGYPRGAREAAWDASAGAGSRGPDQLGK